MTNPVALFPEHFLGRNGFMLLASSTAQQYAQVAIRASETSLLRAYLEQGIITVEYLVGLTEDLWGKIVHAKKRDLPEIELALILPFLSNVAGELAEVQRVLRTIALHDQGSAVWLSALARELYRRLILDQRFEGTAGYYGVFSTKVLAPPAHGFEVAVRVAESGAYSWSSSHEGTELYTRPQGRQSRECLIAA